MPVTITQSSYRFYKDDGAQGAGTPLNIADNSIVWMPDVPLRLRVALQGGGSGAAITDGYKLQFRLNAGTWTDVTGSSTNGAGVATSIFEDDGTATTQILSTGTFVASEFEEVDGTVGSISLGSSDGTDIEFNIKLVQNVFITDSVQFRVVFDGGGLLDTYSVTPEIFVGDTNWFKWTTDDDDTIDDVSTASTDQSDAAPSITPLDNDRVLLVYPDPDNSQAITARVVSRDGINATLNTKQVISTVVSGYQAAVKVAKDKVFVVFDDFTNTRTTGVILTIDDTTITVHQEYHIETEQRSWPGWYEPAFLGDGLVVVGVIQTDASYNDNDAVACLIEDTYIRYGSLTSVGVNTGSNLGFYHRTLPLDSDHFVQLWTDGVDLHSRVGSVDRSDLSITLGTTETVATDTGTGAGFGSVVHGFPVSDDSVFIATFVGSTSTYDAWVLQRSGTGMTTVNTQTTIFTPSFTNRMSAGRIYPTINDSSFYNIGILFLEENDGAGNARTNAKILQYDPSITNYVIGEAQTISATIEYRFNRVAVFDEDDYAYWIAVEADASANVTNYVGQVIYTGGRKGSFRLQNADAKIAEHPFELFDGTDISSVSSAIDITVAGPGQTDIGPNLIALDERRQLVAYQDFDNTEAITVRVMNGNSLGAKTVITTNSSGYVRGIKIDPSGLPGSNEDVKVLIIYDDATAGDLKAVVVTIAADDTITTGTITQIDTTRRWPNWGEPVLLSADGTTSKVAVGLVDTGADRQPYAIAMDVTISSNSISAGTAQQVEATTSNDFQQIIIPQDSSTFLSVYNRNPTGSNNELKVAVCNVSGTTITIGSNTVISSSSTTSYGGQPIGIDFTSTDTFVGLFHNTTGEDFNFWRISRSGNTITVEEDQRTLITTNGSTWLKSAKLETDRGVVLVSEAGADSTSMFVVERDGNGFVHLNEKVELLSTVHLAESKISPYLTDGTYQTRHIAIGGIVDNTGAMSTRILDANLDNTIFASAGSLTLTGKKSFGVDIVTPGTYAIYTKTDVQTITTSEQNVTFDNIATEPTDGGVFLSEDGETFHLAGPGHWLVSYQAGVQIESSEQDNSATRSEDQFWLDIDGTDSSYGRSTMYIRNFDNHFEAHVSSTTVITVNESIDLKIQAQHTATDGVTNETLPDRVAVQFIKLDDEWNYLRLRKSSDQRSNGDGTWRDINWDIQDEIDNGFTHDTVTSNQDITIDDPGKYLVLAQVHCDSVGISGGNGARRNNALRLTLDAAEQDSVPCGYIRDDSGCFDATLTMAYILETTSADQVLNTEIFTQHTGSSAGNNIIAAETGLVIVELPDAGVDYFRLVEATAGEDAGVESNTSRTWDTQDEVDTGSFSHSLVSSTNVVNIDQTAPYIFLAGFFVNGNGSNDTREATYWEFRKNETTELEYGGFSTYLRNNGGGTFSGNSGLVLFDTLTDTDDIEVIATNLASNGAGTYTGNRTYFQGINMTLLFNSIPAEASSLTLTPQETQLNLDFVATAGSLTLTPQNADVDTVLKPTPGTLTLTAQNAVLELAFPADPASLTLTPQNADFDVTLTPDPGTLTLTSQEAILELAIPADTATLTLTAQNGDIDFTLTPDVAPLVLTPNAPLVDENNTLFTTTSILTLTPQAAEVDQIVEATATSLTLTGQTPDVDTLINAGSPSLTLTGQDADVNLSFPADTATLTLTPITPLVVENNVLFPTKGTLTLTGLNADPDIVISSTAGSLTLSGQNAKINTTIIAFAPNEFGWDENAGWDVEPWDVTKSLLLTGQTAIPIVDVIIEATVGTLTLTGQAANVNQTITPNTGTLTLTPQNADVDQTITPNAGTLTLNGQDANVNQIITPNNGVLTLTPQNAEAVNDVIIEATAGSLTLTPQNADPNIALTPDVGSLTLTPQPAEVDQVITPTAGTLTLTGNQAGVDFTFTDVVAGTLTLTPQNADVDTTITPVAGTLTLTPQPAEVDQDLQPNAGTLTLTSNLAGVDFTFTDVVAGTLTLTPQEAVTELAIPADVATLTLTSQNADIDFVFTNVVAGTLTLTGNQAGVDFTFTDVVAGTLTLTPQNADPTITLTPNAGVLTLTGQNADIDQIITPNAGVLSLTGNQAGVDFTFTDVVAGTLTLTPQNAVLEEAIPADAATLTLTPQNADVNQTITPNAGVLTLTGQDANVNFTFTDVVAGTLTLTAQNADPDFALTPDAGVLTLTPQPAEVDQDLQPNAGVLTLTGNLAGVDFVFTEVFAGTLTLTPQNADPDFALTPDTAVLTLTPQEAFVRTILTPEAGLLILTPQETIVNEQNIVTADPGALTLTPQNADIDVTLTPDTGALTLTPQNADIDQVITPTAGTLTLIGNLAGVDFTFTDVVAGTLTLTPQEAVLELAIPADTATLTLTPQNADVDTTITPVTGVLTLTAQQAGVDFVFTDVVAGTLTLTPQNADPTITLTPDAGVLTLTPQPAEVDQDLQPNAGVLTLTGNQAGVDFTFTDVVAGTLTLTPQNAVLELAIPADVATLTLTPQNADIDQVITPNAGILTLTPQETTVSAANTIDATAGTLTLTPQDANVNFTFTNVVAGTLTLTPQNADIDQVITPNAGTLTLNGQDANVNQIITPNNGVLTLTPQNAVLELAIPADVAALTLTPQNADVDTTITPVAGTLTLTPQEANVVIGVAAEVGTLTLTPQPAEVDQTVEATATVLTLTPQPAEVDQDLQPNVAVLTLTGQDANVNFTFTEVVAGTLTLTPQETQLNLAFVADAGALTLTPQNADIDQVITPNAGTLTLTGNLAGVDFVFTDVVAGTLTLTPQDTTLEEAIPADTATLTLTPQNADIDQVITPNAGTLTLTPQDTTVALIVEADVGTLTLTPQPADINQVITPNTGVLTLTPQDTTLEEAIPADVAALTLTPQNADVDQIITPDAGVLTLTPQETVVIEGQNVIVIAVVGSLVLTPQDVNVVVNIKPITTTLTLTPEDVKVNINLLPATESLLLTPQDTTVSQGNEVIAGTGTLVLTPQDADAVSIRNFVADGQITVIPEDGDPRFRSAADVLRERNAVNKNRFIIKSPIIDSTEVGNTLRADDVCSHPLDIFDSGRDHFTIEVEMDLFAFKPLHGFSGHRRPVVQDAALDFWISETIGGKGTRLVQPTKVKPIKKIKVYDITKFGNIDEVFAKKGFDAVFGLDPNDVNYINIKNESGRERDYKIRVKEDFKTNDLKTLINS